MSFSTRIMILSNQNTITMTLYRNSGLYKVRFDVKKTDLTKGYEEEPTTWKKAVKEALGKLPESAFLFKQTKITGCVDNIEQVLTFRRHQSNTDRLHVYFTIFDIQNAGLLKDIISTIFRYQKAHQGVNWDEFPLTGFTALTADGQVNKIWKEHVSGYELDTHLLETGMRQHRDTGHGAADRRDPYAWYRAYY
eukprot:277930_1